MISMIVMLSATTVCYAGSIPEDLLYDDASQVYFGEIKSVDGERITVIQHQNIKGDFLKDSERTYASFMFTDSPETGKIYLCGYYDENNPLYVWEVTSLDTSELEIINTDSLSEKMQEYLNDGLFEEEEKERLSAMDSVTVTQALPKQTVSASEPDTSVQTVDPETESYSFALPMILCGAVLIIGTVFVVWKKRKG